MPQLKEIKKHGFIIKELSFRQLMPLFEKQSQAKADEGKSFNMSHEIMFLSVFNEGEDQPVGEEILDFGAGIVTSLMNTAIELNSLSESQDTKS